MSIESLCCHLAAPEGPVLAAVPFHHEGRGHLFVVHEGPDGEPARWSHAVSEDLLHWRWRLAALAPAADQPDAEGCDAGCVVVDAGQFYAFYTGRPGRGEGQTSRRPWQCRATTRELDRWPERRTVAVRHKPPTAGDTFAHPFVWRRGDRWFMLVGGESQLMIGMVFLYESTDLESWQPTRPFFRGSPDITGGYCAHPELFKIDDVFVLMTTCGRTRWHVGACPDMHFVAETSGVADGGEATAIRTMQDPRGRRIAFGVIPGGASEAKGKVVTLPRLVRLLPDGTLGFEPVPEIVSLRREHEHTEEVLLDEGCLVDVEEPPARSASASAGTTEAAGDAAVGAGSGRLEPSIAAADLGLNLDLDSDFALEVELDDEIDESPPAPAEDAAAPGDGEGARESRRVMIERLSDAVEVVVRIDCADAERVGMAVGCDSEGRGGVRIVYDRLAGRLGAQRLPLEVDEHLLLHVFIDGPVVEAFANFRAVASYWLDPSRLRGRGLAVFAQGGEAAVRSFDLWRLSGDGSRRGSQELNLP